VRPRQAFGETSETFEQRRQFFIGIRRHAV
jgi:hypothetical protein